MRYVNGLMSPKGILLTTALFVIIFCRISQAQVVPSATWPGHALWVGGDVSNFHAGFPYGSSQRIWGVGISADYHWSSRIDVEGEIHFLRYNSFYSEKEDSYLAGPRYLLKRVGKLQPNVQCLIGWAKMQYPFQVGNQSYFTIAPGAGASYPISRRWSLRAEYEYQSWQGSPNYANEPAHRITPNGLHVGIAYQLLRVSRGRY
jgi:opacity protein-like surface antigen